MAIKLPVLPTPDEYEKAVQVLRKGGIVAYPTETYYGLAVDPQNPRAVAALYRLKGRDSEKSLTFLIPNVQSLLFHISHFPNVYKQLTNTLWPGPLTLIFNCSQSCLLPFKKEDNSLAFRISSHPIAHKLCCLYGDAITASSANISGEPAFSSAEQIKNQWGNQIGYLLDGGKTLGESASTIVRCNKNCIEILRTGVVTEHEIRKLLPKSYTICKS